MIAKILYTNELGFSFTEDILNRLDVPFDPLSPILQPVLSEVNDIASLVTIPPALCRTR